jgi:hypothetical protein
MSVALFFLSFMSSQSAFYAHYVHFSKIGNKNKLLDDSGTYGTYNTLKHKFKITATNTATICLKH